ncbi:YkvA family protein [Devosia sp. XK-2]|uniref:YkvA family protein n=1 Tax=Devosia sp. XK-2 TaxID=3126689 RepID=UPI0030D5F0B4
MPRRLEAVKVWARNVKRDVLAIWLAARDPRTPWAARVLAIGVAAYALSPIDLIPDFIPVLGYLDDLLIVPLGILAVIRLVPASLIAEFRAEAAEMTERPVSRAGLIAIIFIWLVLALVLSAWLMRFL